MIKTIPWRQRCKAHKQKPPHAPCKRWASRGGYVCTTHGANAPQVKAAAARRLAEHTLALAAQRRQKTT